MSNVPHRPAWPLNLANTVTSARGGLYVVVAAFVFVPTETRLVWVPAACYGAGVVLDQVDGILARTVSGETPFGKRLDMAFDTLGFVVAPLVAVVWNLLPVYYLSLSAARFLYRGAEEWRRVRNKPVYDPPDSDLGRYLAGAQMLFLTAALAPPAPTGLVFLAAPFVLAPSLAVFVRDYLYMSGRLPRDDTRGTADVPGD